MKITAGILAVAVPAVMLVQAVSIQFAEEDYAGTLLAQAAAVTQQNTGYLEEGELARMAWLLQYTIGKPQSYQEFDAFASIAIARKQYDKAITYMESCITAFEGGNEQKALLLLKQGSLYALTGDYQDAIAYFCRSQLLNPNNADTYLLRAQMYTLLKQAEPAVRDIEEYQALAGEQPSVEAAVAPLYESAGEYENAIRCYSVAINEPSTYQVGNLLSRARCQMLLGNLSPAREDIARYLAEGGEDTGGQVSAMHGVCLMSVGQYAEALSAFHTAIGAGYLNSALLYSQAVLCAYITQDYDTVIADGEEAIRRLDEQEQSAAAAPELAAAQADPIQLREWIALAKLAKADYRGSLSDFQRVAAQDTERQDNRYYQGVCYTALGEYQAAIGCFTISISRGESVSLAYYNRGLCELQTGEYEKSLADLTTVLQRGDNAEAVAGANELLKVFIVEPEQ